MLSALKKKARAYSLSSSELNHESDKDKKKAVLRTSWLKQEEKCSLKSTHSLLDDHLNTAIVRNKDSKDLYYINRQENEEVMKNHRTKEDSSIQISESDSSYSSCESNEDLTTFDLESKMAMDAPQTFMEHIDLYKNENLRKKFLQRLSRHLESTSNDNAEELIKSLDKRLYIMNEVILHEKRHILYLKTLIDFFLKLHGLSVAADTLLHETVVTQKCVKELYEFLSGVVLTHFQSSEANWPSEKFFWQVIITNKKSFKKYFIYYSNYEFFIEHIHRSMKACDKVRKVISEFSQSIIMKGIPFIDNLLRPIHHLTGYRLYAARYLKYASSPPIDETEGTQLCLDTLQSIIAQCNFHSEASLNEVLELQEKSHEQTLLLAPKRKLVKHGEIMKLSARSGEKLPRYLILCSDCMVVCAFSPTAYSSRLDVRHKMTVGKSMYAFKISETAFRVMSIENVVDFKTSTSLETDEWLGRLYECGVSSTASTLCRLGTRAPIWEHDQDVLSCRICKREFTVLFRRHHCRSCGIIVCTFCSRRRLILPYRPGKQLRVCNDCYYYHKSQPKSAKSNFGKIASANG